MEPERYALEDIDLVERFLDGDLSDQETSLFEKRLAGDPAFRSLLEMRSEISEVWVRAHIRESIRQEVASHVAARRQKERFAGQYLPVFTTYRKPMAVAAGILLLGGLGLAIILTNPGLRTTVAAFFRGKTEVPVKSQEDQSYRARREFLATPGIVLFEPVAGKIYSDDENISFHWKGTDGKSISFTILKANTHQPVFVKNINGSDTTFLLMRQVLKPGTYIWFPGDSQAKGIFTIR